ncbi:DNA primase/helicase [Vibrio phage CHOED]|uniref:DNA primase/helicase n=1 Tax=Vibrio phage CHOED TaxID=1458716 RepID=UPI00042F581D|nr:DNA primase/helicase [Vibrio phage CHOED]AHK11902.1 DNA primase [Vibrio phage CHOED]
MSEPIILRKQPHWDDPRVHNPESCCSSDAVSVYADGSACCYSCGAQLFPHPSKFNYFDLMDGKEMPQYQSRESTMNNSASSFDIELRMYEKALFKGFPDRNISIQTAQKFGVKTDTNGNVYFPYYNRDNHLCGFKIRTPAKDFRVVGKVVGDDVMLFGQQLFKGGGKYATIHEGEFDALAGYQMMGSKFPHMSIPTGSKGAKKACQFNLDYLETYERKVLSLDGDKPGREAADAVAPLFTPGTCQVITHPEDRKDACEYSKANMGAVYYNMFWDSKIYTPSGIVNLGDNFEALFDRKARMSHPYPWEGLNKKTRGFRKKELVTLCSGSGMGKSAITRELSYHLLKTTEDNIGVLYLEEDQERTKLGIMGMHAKKLLHLDDVFEGCSRDEIKEAFDATVGTGRFYAFDHFGSCGVEEILNRVRYLIKGLECEWIILDHLSIIVSGLDGEDERKNIDIAMTKLRTLVEETGAGMFLVSHLKRVGGDKGHEDGAQISLSHLRGSQSIAQLSDIVIGLERNQQHSNPLVANTTKLRVLKNRYTGEVGEAGFLLYDRDTGRMSEVTESDLEFGDDDEDEF